MWAVKVVGIDQEDAVGLKIKITVAVLSGVEWRNLLFVLDEQTLGREDRGVHAAVGGEYEQLPVFAKLLVEVPQRFQWLAVFVFPEESESFDRVRSTV